MIGRIQPAPPAMGRVVVVMRGGGVIHNYPYSGLLASISAGSGAGSVTGSFAVSDADSLGSALRPSAGVSVAGLPAPVALERAFSLLVRGSGFLFLALSGLASGSDGAVAGAVSFCLFFT